MNRDTEARIAELEKLQAGWLDGMGLPLQPGVADEARAVAAALSYPPRVFPTPGGGLNLEWGSIEIEVLPEGRFSVFIGNQLLTDDKENDD